MVNETEVDSVISSCTSWNRSRQWLLCHRVIHEIEVDSECYVTVWFMKQVNSECYVTVWFTRQVSSECYVTRSNQADFCSSSHHFSAHDLARRLFPRQFNGCATVIKAVEGLCCNWNVAKQWVISPLPCFHQAVYTHVHRTVKWPFWL